MKKKNSQPAWRRYTVAALIVALLGCISAALLGLAKGVIAFGLYTVKSPEKLNNALWRIANIVKKIKAAADGKEVKYEKYGESSKMLKLD